LSISRQLVKKPVRLSKESYLNFLLLSYQEAFSITRDREISEELAKLTVIKYILHEESIKSVSIKNWLKATTRDKIQYYFSNISESIQSFPDSYSQLEQKITNYLIKDYMIRPDQKKLIELQAVIYSETNKLDRKLLENYLLSACRLCDLNSCKNSSDKKRLQLRILKLRNLFRDEKEKAEIKSKVSSITSSLKGSEPLSLENELNKRHIKHLEFIALLKKSLLIHDNQLLSRYMIEGSTIADYEYPPIKKVLKVDVLLLKRSRYEIQIYYRTDHRALYQISLVIDFEPEKDVVIILTRVSLSSQAR
jgi:hypothetical protein